MPASRHGGQQDPRLAASPDPRCRRLRRRGHRRRLRRRREHARPERERRYSIM